MDGVVETQVGYSGGSAPEPTYKQVCSGDTGHAEAVEVVFDATKIRYEQLLEVFWDNHDPTTPNRQGPNVGSQYRSAIFYHSPEQQEAALASVRALEESGRYKHPISTQIAPAEEFHRAEEYHQRYYEKNGFLGRLIGR